MSSQSQQSGWGAHWSGQDYPHWGDNDGIVVGDDGVNGDSLVEVLTEYGSTILTEVVKVVIVVEMAWPYFWLGGLVLVKASVVTGSRTLPGGNAWAGEQNHNWGGSKVSAVDGKDAFRGNLSSWNIWK